jgi:hypothetical protein
VSAHETQVPSKRRLQEEDVKIDGAIRRSSDGAKARVEKTNGRVLGLVGAEFVTLRKECRNGILTFRDGEAAIIHYPLTL